MNITTECLKAAGCKIYGGSAISINGVCVAGGEYIDGEIRWKLAKSPEKPRFRVKAISQKGQGNE